MKKSVLLVTTSLLFGWNMQGFTSPSNTLPTTTKVWCYKNKIWENNFNYKNYPQIKKIDGGEACWVYNKISLNQEKKDSYEWTEGWNFVTPVFTNWNLDEKFKGNALIGWKYDNGNWKVYNYNVSGIENFTSLNRGEGMFVYIPHIYTKINTQPIFCKNGECSDIITSNTHYQFAIKIPLNNKIKFAIDLYRYSQKKHYKFAIDTININKNINNETLEVCANKDNVVVCSQINNNKEHIINYNKDYLIINIQNLAQHYKKNLKNIKEKFLVKLFTDEYYFPTEKKDSFDKLGKINLNNPKSITFNMEIK